jgi:hypothetical protein
VPGETDLIAAIEIFDDKGVEQEATKSWPGIGVLKDGFIPVGGCTILISKKPQPTEEQAHVVSHPTASM